MDPVSPSTPAGNAGRRRRADGPDAGATTALVDTGYDGYDGRYSGRVPQQAPGGDETTWMPSSAPAGLDRRTPVRPGRRGGRTSSVGAGAAGIASTLPGTSTARRVGVGILVGAVLMLVVATIDSFTGSDMPVVGSFASDGAPAAAPPAPPPPDTAGTCLTWSRQDAADTAAVDCARPHLFEQAGSVKLLDQPTFPADAAWQKLVTDRCTPVVTGYLKGKFDPDGKFRVGALKPSQQRWDGGDKGMRCGLQSASRSGAMLPITGTVASQDQSAIVAPGTCLGITGRTVGDPTDCAKPHAVEAVGVIDLGPQFKDRMPSVDDQDGFLQPACTKAANDYAGNDQVIGQKKLTVYWDNLSEASWNAGSRKVNCNLATLLPDGSGFAALTGSVKGQLTVAGPPGAPGAPGAAPSAPSGPPAGAPGAGGSANSSAPAAPGSSGAQQPQQPGLPNIPPGLPGLNP